VIMGALSSIRTSLTVTPSRRGVKSRRSHRLRCPVLASDRSSPGREHVRVDALSTIVNAAVIATVGLLLAWYTKGRFDANDRRVARIEAKLEAQDARFDTLDGRMASFEARTGSFEARMESFERSLDPLRS
jgi:hypothetical protein